MGVEAKVCPLTGTECTDPRCLQMNNYCEGQAIIHTITKIFPIMVKAASDDLSVAAQQDLYLDTAILGLRLKQRPDLTTIVWEMAKKQVPGNTNGH